MAKSFFPKQSLPFLGCLVALSSLLLLLATPSSAQAVDENDPEIQAAIYHAAGNSTHVPTDIVITDPKQGTVWYTQGHNSITWTGTTPAEFAIQIIYKDPSARASGISLIANQLTSAGTIDTRIGKVETGIYFVRFYNPQDTTKQYALSSEFTVDLKSNKGPAASAAAETETGTTGASSNTMNPSTTASGVTTSNGTPAGNNVTAQTDEKRVGSSSSSPSGQVRTWAFCLSPLLVMLALSQL